MKLSMIVRDERSPIKYFIWIQNPILCILFMGFYLFLFLNGLVCLGEENGRITVAKPENKGKRNFALIVESHDWQSLNELILSPDNTGKPLSIQEIMKLGQFGFKEEHIIYLGHRQASYEKLIAAFSRLASELKPKDNLFIYFLGKCHFDTAFDTSYFFTSDFYSSNQTWQVNHSAFTDIARKSPYKLDARDFGKWLEKLSVHEIYIVMNTSNSFFFLSQVKNFLTNLPGNRAVHFFALNHSGLTEKEEIDTIGKFHECFVGALRNVMQTGLVEIPVARIQDAVGECIGPVSDNTIITESCKNMSYKGRGFVFVRMMGTLEASLRADFKNIIKEINEKRSARELLKEDRTKYINELLTIKNKVEKRLKSEVFYREIDALIFQLEKEIKEIQRIENDFKMIGHLAEEKKTMRYKKLYLTVTDLSKMPEFDSRELNDIEVEIWEKIIETFDTEYQRLLGKLNNKKLHCLTKRKACKYFLSVYRDLKIDDLKVAEITKRSKQYKCSFIEIDPFSNPLSLISSNYNINLYDVDIGHMNFKVGHDLNTGILLLKSPLLLTPSISYYRQLSGNSDGIIETPCNQKLYFDAGRYHSLEVGFDLKWGYSEDSFGIYIFLGSGYRRNFFSIKYIEDTENNKSIFFRESRNKESFGCFTLTTGVIFKFHSIVMVVGFPIFNSNINSTYNYEILEAPNTIPLRPMPFQTKRTSWIGFVVYF